MVLVLVNVFAIVEINQHVCQTRVEFAFDLLLVVAVLATLLLVLLRVLLVVLLLIVRLILLIMIL